MKVITSALGLLESIDNLSYRTISFGFPLLTIGIIAGAVWANEAWGSYWSWDPKETWALITWLVFASYLHARITKSWQGEKPALIASVGFVVVWICYLGVNFLGKGLHTYGQIFNSYINFTFFHFNKLKTVTFFINKIVELKKKLRKRLNPII